MANPSLLPSLVPSLLPTAALGFSDDERAAFAELDDDADLDVLCDALFPDELTRA